MLSLSKHDSTDNLKPLFSQTILTNYSHKLFSQTHSHKLSIKLKNLAHSKTIILKTTNKNHGKSPFTITSIFNFPSRHNRPNCYAYSCHRLNVVVDNYF